MKISIAGTGHVANALGDAFKKAGFEILWIYGRNLTKAASLAGRTGSRVLKNPSDAAKNKPDIIIIAVKDDAITTVSKMFKTAGTLVVHTSGSIAMSALSSDHKNCGVFYPLQTFSNVSRVDMKKTPVCVEAGSDSDLKKLLKAASAISGTVYVTESEVRREIHLAAVFANNFSNHMFYIASEILKKQHLPFELLRPLILSTVNNAFKSDPSAAQTGPAKRGDAKVMKKQMSMLKKHPDWQEIYEVISKGILKAGHFEK